MVAYSVVVVTWQSAQTLEALVATMNRHLDSAPELVVVDNRSRDDPERRRASTAARCASCPSSGIRLRRGLQHRGRECQRLVRRMLNADTELVDPSLDGLAAFALERQALRAPGS